MIRSILSYTVCNIIATLFVFSCMAEEPAVNERSNMIPTDKAIKQMEARVAKNPKDYLSYTLMGQLYLRQAKEQDTFADYQKAEQAFTTALAIKGDNRSAKNQLAVAYLAQHRFKDALELSQQILKTSPNFAPAWATFSDAAIELGQYTEAEKGLENLLKMEQSPAIWDSSSASFRASRQDRRSHCHLEESRDARARTEPWRQRTGLVRMATRFGAVQCRAARRGPETV